MNTNKYTFSIYFNSYSTVQVYCAMRNRKFNERRKCVRVLWNTISQCRLSYKGRGNYRSRPEDLQVCLSLLKHNCIEAEFKEKMG